MSVRPRHAFRPGFEHLEDRSLPATGLTASLSQGVLDIRGTAGADTIVLRQSGDNITLDGYSGSVSASQIKQIRIDGGAGNDRIQVSLSPQLTARTFVQGGGGNDILVYSKGQPFGGFGGFESYTYGPGATPGSGSTGGGQTGQPGGSTDPQQAPGWYFETKSALVGVASERFGPYTNRPDAAKALQARLQLFEGDRSAITRDIYYVAAGSGSAGGTAGGSGTSTGGGSGGSAGAVTQTLKSGERIGRVDVSGSVVTIAGQNGGRLTLDLNAIPPGDGASVPWPSYKAYLDQRSLEVWQVHDYLYSTLGVSRTGLTRAQADDVMLMMMVRRGYDYADLFNVYNAVRTFGWMFYNT